MSQKRFSRDGFQRLGHYNSDEMPPPPPQPSGNNPNDVTIDIPLTKVTTSKSTGARKAKTNTSTVDPSNEKIDPALDSQVTSHHSHFRRPGGRRRKLEEQGKGEKAPQDGSLTAMGRFYNKVYHFSVVTRYLLYVAPLALLIAVPIIVGATAAPNARIGGTRITWFFTWIEVVWCSVWVSKLIARFLPFIFQFIVGVVSSGTRKYALILAALEIPLSLVGWAVTNLVTFRPLMTRTPGRRNTDTNGQWLDIMEKVLAACLFSTLILLVEKILIQLISISYHRKQFDSKIKDSKRNINLITQLYEASKSMFPTYCPEFAEEDYIISDVLGINNLATPGHKRSGSATPMRLLQGVQRVGEGITSAFGNMASEITGKQVFNPTASHSLVILALEKRKSSEALARRLWLSFVLEGKEALYLEDMIEVFGHDKEEDAEEIFSALDLDGNGDISLDEMVLRVSEFGRERAALANSMRDVDQAITVLDNLLMTVVFVMCVFIFVAWLNQNFTTTLATAGTALLSLSFVFSATAQELLGSCIFLFVKHPYDVGDRVDITNEQLVVERISLLYTMFRKVKDHKRTQVPNIVLNSLWVDNVSRSKAMREQINLFISFDTTFEDIELLRKEMQDFVNSKENARDYQPEVDIEVLDLAEMNKLQLKIEIRHKSNWSIESVRAARRSKFMCALVQAMRKVPIYAPGGGGPAAGDKANPTYSVAISDDVARENKQEFDKTKEAARLVPTVKPEDTTATSSSTDFFNDTPGEARERAQAQALNQRRVVVDPTNQGREDMNSSALERQRTNDLEEVKNIMRRQSTVGRRKVHQQAVIEEEEAPAYQAPTQTSTLSTAQAPRIPSYYEDNAYAQPSASGDAPAIHVTSGSQGSMPYIAPLQTQQGGRMRSESVARTPTQYEGVPGNAFSQQQQSLSQSPPRRLVPGMSQMKGSLQGSSGQR
ncbi:hypothetical protein OHC33_010091 [Knufia fluminis]|uniref:Mechanosensitive ion channel protein n=1 Tax=Knufia fluminis TaxID=191047 RepID=A0AAN8EG63_9EURO|nr:hypothetical protein OHC33_010091 [Knufia fluminis]